MIGHRLHRARLARRLLLLRFERRFGAGFFRIVVAHWSRPNSDAFESERGPENQVPAVMVGSRRIARSTA
jgi:hypothetical protein